MNDDRDTIHNLLTSHNKMLDSNPGIQEFILGP